MESKQKEELKKSSSERMIDVKITLQTTKNDLFGIVERKEHFDLLYEYTLYWCSVFIDMAEIEYKKIIKKHKSGKINEEEYIEKIENKYRVIHNIHLIIKNLDQNLKTVTEYLQIEDDLNFLTRFKFIKLGLNKMELDELPGLFKEK